MASITDHRRALRAAVEPLLQDGEHVTVAAGPSEYASGLNTLGFLVSVAVPAPDPETAAERLDELLEPNGGVKAALEEVAVVKKSSGHQAVPGDEPELAATWTTETFD